MTEYRYFPEVNDDARSGFLQQVVADADGQRLTTTYEVDQLGQVIAIGSPKAVAGDERFISRMDYDRMGRLVRSTGPGPAPAIRHVYDACGQLERTEIETFDMNGQPQFGGALIRLLRHDDSFRLVSEEVMAADGSQRLVTRHVKTVFGHGLITIRPNGSRLCTALDRRMLPISQTRGFGSQDASTERHAYDGDRRVRQTSTPNGHSTSTFYDALGRPVRTINPMGVVTVRTFDKRDRMTLERVFQSEDAGFRLASRREVEYDDLGRVMRSAINVFDGPLGPVAAEELDQAFRDEPGLGRRVVEDTWHDSFGRVVRRRDRRGYVTVYQYDPLGRLASATDPIGNIVRHEYDLHGNAVRTDIIEPAPGGVQAEQRTFSVWRTFDYLDRQISVTDALGNVRHWSYDSRGNVVSTTNAAGQVSETDVDLHGRTVAVRDLSAGGVSITRLEYDGNGNLVAVVDPLSRRTSFAYDELDRRRTVVYPDDRRSLTDYDRDGNVVRTVDADGHIHSVTLDPMGRPTRVEVSHVSGESVPGPSFQAFQYDAHGNRVLEANDNTNAQIRRSSTGLALEERMTVLTSDGTSHSWTVGRSFDDAGYVF